MICQRAGSAWLWEVSELGATTKRADVEALKGFLSREVFTLRPAYGHYEIVKPGLASFVGTVNNSSGIFSDPTGSRRYWATTLTTIAWSYAEHVDKGQLWAEAYAAYKAGEAWTLTGEEAEAARAINEGFSFADPVEDLLRKFYTLDPARADKWTNTVEILTTLQTNGLGTSARANAMYLSATLKRLGFTGGQKRGDVRGYAGIW
jgi:putative DNA primase/helicase